MSTHVVGFRPPDERWETPRNPVAAMRADRIRAPQDRGPWYIRRVELPELGSMIAHAGFDEPGPAVITTLFRWTDATLHLGHGEAVMSDEPRELRRHLPIVLRARGRVLVTGLGLGCVVRGLLARPAVEHVDVVEVDPAVVALVWPSFEDRSRVTLHQGDALTYPWPADARWDFAWHDVWCEHDSLHVLHVKLLARYRGRVRCQQGAWQTAAAGQANLAGPARQCGRPLAPQGRRFIGVELDGEYAETT